MDFLNLPRYPEHGEVSPSQSERLNNADSTDRWWLFVVVIFPVLIALILLTLVLFYWGLSHAGFVM